MRKMLIPEYRRRVFNECMLECMCKIHGMVLNGDCSDDSFSSERLRTMSRNLTRTFMRDRLDMDECQIRETKEKLSESVTFIKDCIDVSESIANDKAECAQKNGLEMDNDQKIELGAEDKDLIDKLFAEKSPTLQVDQIRDATVKALLAEDKKAQEIKDSLAIANAQVSGGKDPETLKETVNRLEHRGPTSLMNAIINSVTVAAVKDVNENAKSPVMVGTIMKENAEEIRDRATMIYALYEMCNVLDVMPYTANDIRKEAQKIYYNK